MLPGWAFLSTYLSIKMRMLHEVHSRTFVSNVLRLCTKDETQGSEDEVERSVLTYVTETEFRKQRSRSPSCNSLKLRTFAPALPADLAIGLQ